MLTLLFWLMMGSGLMHGQAKVATPQDDGNVSALSLATVKEGCEENDYISIAREDGTYDKIAVCHGGHWHRYTPPVEHVIEIRTKRDGGKATFATPCVDRMNVLKDKQTLCLSFNNVSIPALSYWRDGDVSTATCEKREDVRQLPNCKLTHTGTRELWIDNVKFGIIKGLD